MAYKRQTENPALSYRSRGCGTEVIATGSSEKDSESEFRLQGKCAGVDYSGLSRE